MKPQGRSLEGLTSAKICCYTLNMDKDTEILLDTIASKAAGEAVAKMREFHQADLKVLGERMEVGFEKIDRRFQAVEGQLERVETRLERVENALTTLLKEFKEDREKVAHMEKQIADLLNRVSVLEQELAAKK